MHTREEHTWYLFIVLRLKSLLCTKWWKTLKHWNIEAAVFSANGVAIVVGLQEMENVLRSNNEKKNFVLGFVAGLFIGSKSNRTRR